MMFNVSDITDDRMQVIIYDARYKLVNETVPISAIEMTKATTGTAVLESIKEEMGINHATFYICGAFRNSEGGSFKNLATHSWESAPKIVSVIVANLDGACVVQCKAC
eukprot:GHVU01145021.1.p1 GENE.GHVU01145021.1~~GHVU01145021.1.p1  ORF type:complete len:108 (-),score=12.09 GHVU01145021.1:527-850(-)